MNQAAALTATDSPAPALWLVCAPHGWAWGWGHHQPPQTYTEGAWPEGEPPLALPTELWQPALQRALAQRPAPIPVHVLCASWGRDSAPEWWPHRKAGVRQWQTWLAAQGGQLQSVAQAQADPGLGELKTWVQHSRWQGVTQLAPLPSDPGAGWRPWQLLAGSSLAALSVHLLLVGVWQPWWNSWRDQALVQAEQQRQQELALQAEAQARSRRAQQQAQTQAWRQAQQAALQPLQQLSQWLQQLGPEPQPQLWLELRHAKGSWTVLGVASHEMPLRELLHAPFADQEPVLIQSSASTWPPEPAMGWPAWRFEWQTLAPDPNLEADLAASPAPTSRPAPKGVNPP